MNQGGALPEEEKGVKDMTLTKPKNCPEQNRTGTSRTKERAGVWLEGGLPGGISSNYLKTGGKLGGLVKLGNGEDTGRTGGPNGRVVV